MKTIIVIAFLVTILAAMPGGGYAAEDSYIMIPTPVSRTCGGYSAGPSAQSYIFGFAGSSGFCTVKIFYANTYGEARECAMSLCKSCRVEDITGRYGVDEDDTGFGRYRAYCPKGSM